MTNSRQDCRPTDRPWTHFLPQVLRKRVESRHDLQDVIGNTGWQFADSLVRMGVGLLIGVWVARYLGPEHFGLLSFALAFVTLFSPLASLGLDDIVVRNLAREPTRRDETLGTAFVLKLLGGGASFAAATAVIRLVRPGDVASQRLVAIVAAGALFQAANVIEYWFHARVEAKYNVLARNAAFLLCAVVKIALILARAPLVAFAWVATFEVMVGAASLVIVYRGRGYVLRKWVSRLEVAKGLLKDSWPLVFSCIVIMIYLRIDQVMLGEMVGSKAVGVYSVAVRLTEVWYFIPSAVYWSVLPSLVEAKASDGKIFLQRLQKYYNLMALSAYSLAIPVTFLAKWLVLALFGSPYAEAGLMLQVMIWANLFTFLELARSAFFNVMNWNRIYLATLALGAALNVALNLFLIPRYGGVGAAIATCISYWFAAHGACFLYKPLHKTAFMLSRAIVYPKVW